MKSKKNTKYNHRDTTHHLNLLALYNNEELCINKYHGLCNSDGSDLIFPLFQNLFSNFLTFVQLWLFFEKRINNIPLVFFLFNFLFSKCRIFILYNNIAAVCVCCVRVFYLKIILRSRISLRVVYTFILSHLQLVIITVIIIMWNISKSEKKQGAVRLLTLHSFFFNFLQFVFFFSSWFFIWIKINCMLCG